MAGIKTVNFVSDLITENDGQTVCPARVLLIAGSLIFLGLACYGVYLEHSFNAMQYGTGYGSLLGAGAAGIGYKAKTDKP